MIPNTYQPPETLFKLFIVQLRVQICIYKRCIVYMYARFYLNTSSSVTHMLQIIVFSNYSSFTDCLKVQVAESQLTLPLWRKIPNTAAEILIHIINP